MAEKLKAVHHDDLVFLAQDHDYFVRPLGEGKLYQHRSTAQEDVGHIRENWR